MHRYNRLDLVETHLKEALIESWEQQVETLESQREQFQKYKSRLAVVRAMKERNKLLLGLLIFYYHYSALPKARYPALSGRIVQFGMIVADV